MGNTSSQEQKLIVIKHSVTAAGHAAARPLTRLPETQPLCHPAQPGGSPANRDSPAAGPAPCRAAAPAGRDQGRADGARPRPLRLAAPGAQRRAAATGRACRVEQVPDLTSSPGWPAQAPSRMKPQSGLPAQAGSVHAPPPQTPPPRDVSAPQPCGATFTSAPRTSLVRVRLETAEALVLRRRFRERRSDQPTAIPRAPLRSPGIPLDCPHPSGGEATLSLLGLASREESGADPGASAAGDGHRRGQLDDGGGKRDPAVRCGAPEAERGG
nr:uncharacterized protein LOC116280891 [Vicugna pacos]